MLIQPLLLTPLTPRAGIYAGFEIRVPRSRPADRPSGNRSSGNRPAEGKEAAGDRPPRSDRPDTVEISREAEIRLAGQLSDGQRRQVVQLQSRDREVRAHEQAHLSAAGPYARGGASFDYQTGPDGRRYAVGGEVSIDASPVPDDPEATVYKARVIRAAALAPASPSAQDRRMAAAATKMESQARQELRRQEVEEEEETDETAGRYGPESFIISGADEQSESKALAGTLFDAVV